MLAHVQAMRCPVPLSSLNLQIFLLAHVVSMWVTCYAVSFHCQHKVRKDIFNICFVTVKQ